jgi:hypothetical protein
MTISHRKEVLCPGTNARRLGILGAGLLALATAAWAQDGNSQPAHAVAAPTPQKSVWPSYVIPGAPEVSTLYADGSQIVVDTSECWRLMCGSNPNGITADNLRQWADNHAAIMNAGPVVQVGNPERTTGLNVVFNVGGGAPPGTTAALAMVSSFLASTFNDAITVTINLSFQDMGGGGVIGATSSSAVSNITYTNSRNGLVAGMDSDDVIQTWLPTGSTVPVRYDGSSPNVTNELYVDWTRANYRATVGSISGLDASMTFNTQFAFDFDPSDGIASGTMSFVDVALHETGHALGFISGADGFGSFSFTSLDLYRFQRTDGSNNYNPDTYEDFQTTPRLVSFNSPDDDHNSDIIIAEYRMSDGDPYQASHFREQSSPWIGIMDPAFSLGETHYPNFYSAADINMFDAIGYDFPPCQVPHFMQQPQDQAACVGATIQMCVAVDIPNPQYQWRIGSTDLVDDGVHIVGATTTCLNIIGLTSDDVSDLYNCQVTNATDGCVATSDFVTVGVYEPVAIASQPADATIPEFGNVNFSVTASGSTPLTYQWRHNGVDLTNSPVIFGVTTPTLTLLSAQANQAGYYDCEITNTCGMVTSDAAHLVINTGYGAGAGDLNCDGSVSFADINPFVLALSGGETTYYNSYPNCHWYNGDVNSDGNVDFADINPFVLLLTGL